MDQQQDPVQQKEDQWLKRLEKFKQIMASVKEIAKDIPIVVGSVVLAVATIYNMFGSKDIPFSQPLTVEETVTKSIPKVSSKKIKEQKELLVQRAQEKRKMFRIVRYSVEGGCIIFIGWAFFRFRKKKINKTQTVA